jgi:hypothetical protein
MGRLIIGTLLYCWAKGAFEFRDSAALRRPRPAAGVWNCLGAGGGAGGAGHEVGGWRRGTWLIRQDGGPIAREQSGVRSSGAPTCPRRTEVEVGIGKAHSMTRQRERVRIT